MTKILTSDIHIKWADLNIRGKLWVLWNYPVFAMDEGGVIPFKDYHIKAKKRKSIKSWEEQP